MGSYLDRDNQLDHILKAREDRISNREIDPMAEAEEAERRAEKQKRIDEQLAIGARRLAGDPEILAQDAARAEERRREEEEEERNGTADISNEPEYY